MSYRPDRLRATRTMLAYTTTTRSTKARLTQAQLLQSRTKSDIRAYVTCELARYITEELIEVTRSLMKEGHTALKIVAAGGPHLYYTRRPATDASITVDARCVAALREALDPRSRSLSMRADGRSGFSP